MCILDRIEANSNSEANVFKSIKEAIKELKEYSQSDNQRYIMCFTDSFDDNVSNENRIKKIDVQELLKQFNANLIVLGLGMDLKSS